MRVRASTGYFILQALGAALCKQQRAGEHRGEAAVARRQCRSQRRGTGMLVHEYVHVHISIRVYPYERIVFQSLSISPSVHIHALCTRAHTRKVAFMHAYMKTCTYTDLMSEMYPPPHTQVPDYHRHMQEDTCILLLESLDMNTHTSRKYSCVGI